MRPLRNSEPRAFSSTPQSQTHSHIVEQFRTSGVDFFTTTSEPHRLPVSSFNADSFGLYTRLRPGTLRDDVSRSLLAFAILVSASITCRFHGTLRPHTSLPFIGTMWSTWYSSPVSLRSSSR